MEDKTVIAITRCVCGTAILITSVLTHMDGTLQGISLLLMGVPIELFKKEKA